MNLPALAGSGSVQGAIGNAYISLYAPRMPYKDEIVLTTGVSSKEISEEVYERHKDDK